MRTIPLFSNDLSFESHIGKLSCKDGGDYNVSEAAENIASAELYAEDKEKEAREAEAKAKEAEKKRLALSEKAESRDQEKREFQRRI